MDMLRFANIEGLAVLAMAYVLFEGNYLSMLYAYDVSTSEKIDASDGIWPMFFALVERERYGLSLINGCFRILAPDGQRSVPFYFFSITQSALASYPWSDGTVYILPHANFEPHPPRKKDGITYESMEWASLQTVQPIAYVRVNPSDFPFIAQVRGHDQAIVAERIAADQMAGRGRHIA